jgi:single-stranded DNA-binding protein
MNTCHILGYLDNEGNFQQSHKGAFVSFLIKLKDGPYVSTYQILVTAFGHAAEFIQQRCKLGDLLSINGYLVHDRRGSLYLRSFRVENLSLQMPSEPFFPRKESFHDEEEQVKPISYLHKKNESKNANPAFARPQVDYR